ncbi:MAG: nicotinate-nucleotide adenylyltransferase [Armatimonadaceae bacterium]
MHLGIFGGSFDPVHFGHLRLAEEAREQAELDKVLFVPTQVSPFKVGRTQTPAAIRLQMLEIAVSDNPAFAISDTEVRRPGPSYTVDTLRELSNTFPDAELYFITGTDAVRDLPKWHQPEEVLRLARFLVSVRPGVDKGEVLAALPDLWEERIRFIEMTELDISSTYLRERLRQGGSARYLLPRNVIDFIESQGLYRDVSGDGVQKR